MTFTERCEWSEGQAVPVSGRAALWADTTYETETILENGHTQRGGQPGTVKQEWGATP